MTMLFLISFIGTVVYLSVSTSVVIQDAQDEKNKKKSYFFIVAMAILTIIFLSLSMTQFVDNLYNKPDKAVKPQRYEMITDTLYKKIK